MPLPALADTAERLQNFAVEGGSRNIFSRLAQPDTRQFDGLGWGEIQNAEGAEGFHILRWNEDEGPLAKSDEHLSLPLSP